MKHIIWSGALALSATLWGCSGSGQHEADLQVDAEVKEEQDTAEASLTGPVPVGTVLRARYNTYHRSGPASSYSALQIIPAGALVTVVTSQPTGSYYNVSYSGKNGWAYGPYLDVAPSQADAGTGTGTGSQVVVEILADTNRDGVVSLTGDSDRTGKTQWTSTRGAVFLPNIDDDTLRCPSSPQLSDAQLAACNDAADEVVNGADDVLDLAPLRVSPWPSAPGDAVGRLGISPASAKVRLFKKVGGSFVHYRPAHDSLSAAELRQGVELFLEGTDVVRNAAVWDGRVTVSLRVTAAGLDKTDQVAMRVAPLILFHHGTPVDQLYATYIQGDADSHEYVYALHGALQASGAKGLMVFYDQDQWTQDFFETGFVAMPAPGGKQQVIRVNLRSANRVSNSPTHPLRPAGRLVFTALRGKDSAGLQQWDPAHDPGGDMDTLDSFGNTETIPPFTHNGVHYPFGRILRGSVPSFRPDPSVTTLLNSQGVQPVVTVDTSWLLVGHVDETISFIPAATSRGWVALVNDPALARSMLQQQQAAGRGGLKMFVGKKWLEGWGEYSAEVSINQVLADTEVMAESARAASAINAQVAVLKSVTGLTDAEIIRVPFLHYPVSGYSLGYQPGTVNGVSVNAQNFISPDPHGPKVNGVDIFKSQLSSALSPYGVTVRFVEDWNLYHRLAGEVHCGSNAARALPGTRWWEAAQ
jgi:protein-arginine deiminase